MDKAMPKARKKFIGSPQGQNWILGTTPMSGQGGGAQKEGKGGSNFDFEMKKEKTNNNNINNIIIK